MKQSCKSYATFCSPFSVSTVTGRVWVCSKMYWIIQRLGHKGEPRSGTSIELASGEIQQLDNRFSQGFKHLRRRKFLFLELLSHMQYERMLIPQALRYRFTWRRRMRHECDVWDDNFSFQNRNWCTFTHVYNKRWQEMLKYELWGLQPRQNTKIYW